MTSVINIPDCERHYSRETPLPLEAVLPLSAFQMRATSNQASLSKVGAFSQASQLARLDLLWPPRPPDTKLFQRRN